MYLIKNNGIYIINFDVYLIKKIIVKQTIEKMQMLSMLCFVYMLYINNLIIQIIVFYN